MVMNRVGYIVRLAQTVGPVSAANILGRRALGKSAPVWVGSRRCGRFSVRPMESDFQVATSVFGKNEYRIEGARHARLTQKIAEARAAGKTPLIVDAGANVGYSAIYFASEFPQAVVVAIEPDPETLKQLVANTEDYRNVRPLLGALWSDNKGVSLGKTDQPSWARTTVGAGATPSYTLEDVLNLVPSVEPILLKLDIEGAERDVCEASPAAVARFPVVMVEPHDWMTPGKACLAPLYRAVAHKEMDTMTAGETIALFDADVCR